MNFTDVNHTNMPIPVVGLDLDINITNIKFKESSLNGSVPLIKINDGWAAFQISDLNLLFTLDYFYVTTPPILADMGSAWFAITALDLSVSLNTNFNQSEELLQVDLLNITLNCSNPEPFLMFDGVADYSQVVTSLADTFTAIVRNRVISVVNE